MTSVIISVDSESYLYIHTYTHTYTYLPTYLPTYIPPTRNLKFAFHRTPNLNASQWNIGCVGSQTQNSGVGHVHFTFLCVNFIRVGSCFSVEYGLNFFITFYGIIFSRFYRKQTRTYIKNLRDTSLDSNAFNIYVKFKVCNLHNKRDIHVQKIKV